MIDNWQPYLFYAYSLARRSQDPSTQNAALLVNTRGTIVSNEINRLPDGVQNIPERWDRPLKYKVVEHAERNAIFHAARCGIGTAGLIMVCPWAPCSNCAKAIIQSGISKLVTHKQAHDRTPEFWREDIEIAFVMLKEAGVEVIMYDGVIGVQGILHSGKLWNP